MYLGVDSVLIAEAVCIAVEWVYQRGDHDGDEGGEEMKAKPLPLISVLAAGLEDTLRDENIWWRGERQFGLPDMRRWADHDS